MLLWNTQTLRQEEVPHEQVQDALASGRFGFKKDERVNFIDPDGNTVSIPGVNAHEAMGRGYSLEAPEQAEQRQRKAKYGEGTEAGVKAAAAGALRGLTFGASDLLATKTARKDTGFTNPLTGKTVTVGRKESLEELSDSAKQRKEALAAYRELNPTASMAGEIGGAVLPTLLTGGLGAAGAGVRAAGALPRAVAAAGRSTEQAVMKALAQRAAKTGSKKLARQIVERAVPKMAGSAIEGAFYGAGAEVSEAALGDTDLTAERILAGAGMGALLGGGAAGILGAGGVGLEKGLRGTGKALQSTGKAIEKLYERATGNIAAPGLGRAYAKLSGLVSGAGEGAVSKFTGKGTKAARIAATKPEAIVDDYGHKLWKLGDELLDASTPITDEAIGAGKLKRFTSAVRKGNEVAVAESAAQAVDEVGGSLDDMIAAGAGNFEQAGLKKLRDIVAAHQSRLTAIAQEGGEEVNGQIFIALDNLKRDLGVRTRQLQRVARRNPTVAVKDTHKRLDDLYHNVRNHLELDELYGDAARIQRSVNRRWTEHLSDENFRRGKQFWAEKGSVAGVTGEESFEGIWRADDSKFLSFARNLKSGEGLEYEYLRDWARTRRGLIDEIAANYDLDPGLIENLKRAKKAAAEFEKTLHSAKDDVVRINQLKDLERMPASGHWLAAAVGGGIGYAAGDEKSALAGAALAKGGMGLLSRPGLVVRQLAQLERMSNGVRGRVSSSIKNFISSGTKRAGAAYRKVPLQRAVAPAAVKLGREDKQDRFNRRFERFSRFVSDPEYAMNTLTASTSKLSGVAPNLSQAMQTKAATAIQFLYSKAPKRPAPQGIIVQKPWKPSEAELARWERYYRAVQDPMVALDDFENGSLSYESVEVLKAVYPKLYEDIAREISEEVATLKGPLPYEKRLQLSVLLGVPVDSTTTPQFAQALQMSYVQEAAEEAARTPGKSRPKRRKFKDSALGSSQTKAQRIESR